MSDSEPAAESRSHPIQGLAQTVTNLFLLWVLLGAALAYGFPPLFTGFKPYIGVTLGVIMFGMGMTLTGADFARVLRRPRAVVAGILAQFIIMPSVAYALVKLFHLGPELAIGVLLVGCSPGGTASNVVSYLAKADVALSVTLTACTTILGIVVTPLLVKILGDQYLPVDGYALFRDVLQIILVPVVAGLLVRRYFTRIVSRLEPVFPLVSVLGICAIIACVVALSADKIGGLVGVVGLVVVLHNSLGLLFGYTAGKLLRLPESACRTIAIEVGMQNSGLAASLATQHFPALAAIPAALFSVVQNVTGSILATVFRRSSDANAGEVLSR